MYTEPITITHYQLDRPWRPMCNVLGLELPATPASILRGGERGSYKGKARRDSQKTIKLTGNQYLWLKQKQNKKIEMFVLDIVYPRGCDLKMSPDLDRCFGDIVETLGKLCIRANRIRKKNDRCCCVEGVNHYRISSRLWVSETTGPFFLPWCRYGRKWMLESIHRNVQASV